MQNEDVDYPYFVGILALLIINSTISFVEENNDGNAAAALMARLAPKAKVYNLTCFQSYLFHQLFHSVVFIILSGPLFLCCFPLKYHLHLQVLRDGQWNEEDASVLVPGDIISIKLGDIIPADACLLKGDPLKIDQVSGYVKL